MALILTGSRGAAWRAADWVARGAFAFLIPGLERCGAADLAAHCREALETGAAGIDLRDLLDEPRGSRRWTLAVEAALAALEAEGSASWNEPECFACFAARVRALGALARSDGNALLASLAARTTEKFDAGTP